MTLLATLVLMAAATGCVEPIVPEGPDVTGDLTLSLQISVPGADGLTTKSSPLPPQPGEADIHTLEIWAFPHLSRADASGELLDDDDSKNPQAVAYGNVSVVNGIASLTIPKAVITAGQLNLDFFVLANGGSVGFAPADAHSNLKRKVLRDKAFGDSDGNGFGSTPVTAVPTTEGQQGLPMSCYFDNGGAGFDITFLKYGFKAEQIAFIRGQVTNQTVDYSLDNVSPALSDAQKTFIGNTTVSSWSALAEMLSPTITLTRAISKIRFVFTKAANMTETPKIISVEILRSNSTPEALPKTTYVFPTPTGNISLPSTADADYLAFSWGAATSEQTYLLSSIPSMDTPHRLLKGSKEMEEYEQDLTDAIDLGEAAEKRVYLRETDQTVKARITYSIGGQIKDPVDIYLPQEEHFYRNNWWTIYAFFMTYNLEFQVTTAPWDGIGSSGKHLQ